MAFSAETRSPAVVSPLSISRPWLLLALAWFAGSVWLLGIGLHQAFWVAPTEATMGNVQRVFYWHVPSAILSLIFPYVNLVGSLAFLALRRRNPRAAAKADAISVAAAEITVVFASICLLTGMIWGRAAWGIWWTWSARLTSELLLWLLYVAYLLTRKLSSNGQTSTLGAVLAVFAAIDVPIVYYSIQWWRDQHPAPVLTGDGELDPTMKAALGWNTLAWFAWGIFILGLRYALERRRQRLAELATQASLEEEADLSALAVSRYEATRNSTGTQAQNAL